MLLSERGGGRGGGIPIRVHTRHTEKSVFLSVDVKKSPRQPPPPPILPPLIWCGYKYISWPICYQ